MPALLWLVLAERGARLPRLGAFAVGSAVGLLPLVLGMLLLRDEVGGTRELLDWLRDNREGLDPGQDDQGVLGHVEVVWRESRYVFAGQWPWAMILQESRTAALEGLKATLLVVLPVVALLPWFAEARRRRVVGVPLALAASFGVGALFFGGRLDGHHYTAVLPLLYAAFGAGCAVILPRGDGAGASFGSVPAAVRTAVVAVAVGIVVVSNLDGERDFQDRLAATGGVGLYSDAIDRFSWDVDTSAPGAAVHAPDWGTAMPVSYLSDTAFPVRMGVDAAALRAEVCAGKPQLVAFLGEDNEAKFDAVADVSGRPVEDVRTWRQRDGLPVFQVARFGAGAGCEPPSAADAPPAGDEPARSR